jgi:hypothetical protein
MTVKDLGSLVRIWSSRITAPGARGAKLARLRPRLRDPEWRRYGYLLVAGKVLGLGHPVEAADAPKVLTGSDVVNPLSMSC